MAGSSVPLTWRSPAVDVKRGSKLKQLVAVSYHTLDGYGFHALEAVQSLSGAQGGRGDWDKAGAVFSRVRKSGKQGVAGCMTRGCLNWHFPA